MSSLTGNSHWKRNRTINYHSWMYWSPEPRLKSCRLKYIRSKPTQIKFSTTVVTTQELTKSTPYKFCPKEWEHTVTHSNSPAKMKSNIEADKKITLPYIKDRLEITILWKPFKIDEVHKSVKSFKSIHMQNEGWKIRRKTQHYLQDELSKLWEKLHRLHKYQLAVKCHDISSFISMDVDSCGHTLD